LVRYWSLVAEPNKALIGSVPLHRATENWISVSVQEMMLKEAALLKAFSSFTACKA